MQRRTTHSENARPDNHVMIGNAPPIQEIRKAIAKVAGKNLPILITGESGTGKELLARELHSLSRRDGRFVPLNCCAIPEGLIESELFGHVRGAFTSAVADKKGAFEVADGGTLFLDEIGDTPLQMQVKLLRVLQDRTFERVGAPGLLIHSDVRIISATNKDLNEEVGAKRFREDLLYRLNVVVIEVPPLRDRLDDVSDLVIHFLKSYNDEYDQVVRIDEGAMSKISEMSARLPGNIRGLQSLVFRACVLCDNNLITESNPALCKLVISEGDIRLAIKKCGPFNLVLPNAKGSSAAITPFSLVAIISAILNTKPDDVLLSIEVGHLDLIAMIVDERRSLISRLISDGIDSTQIAEALHLPLPELREEMRSLGLSLIRGVG